MVEANSQSVIAPDTTTAAPLTGLPRPLDFQPVQDLHSGLFNQRAAVRAAIGAGLLGTLIGIIPILGIVLTGALAVYLYRRQAKIPLPLATGARLGAAAGIVLFAVNSLFIIPIIVMHAQQGCIDALTQFCQKVGINTANPQFQASIGELFTPAGLARAFVVALALTAIGGALGAFLMRQPPQG